jgi:hypothetical protein
MPQKVAEPSHSVPSFLKTRQSGRTVQPTSMYPQSLHSYFDENQDAFTPAKTAILLSVGGAIGLAAAAAVRWLNGGDFELLPSPHIDEEPINIRTRIGGNEEEAHNSKTSDDERDEQLRAHLQSLVDALEGHTLESEKLMKHLSSAKESQITNEAMSFLRKQNDTTDSDVILTRLAEIQDELSRIRRDMIPLKNHGTDNERFSNWDTRLSKTIESLYDCMSYVLTDERTAAFDSCERNNEGYRVDLSGTVSTTISEGSIEDEVPSVAEAIRHLVLENEAKALRLGSQLLYLYVVNLSNQPVMPRYRKIFTTNESFQTVNSLSGGRSLLKAIGFVETSNGKCLEWVPKDSNRDEADYLRQVANAAAALSILKTPSTEDPFELLAKINAAADAESRYFQSEEISTPARTTASDSTEASPRTPDVGTIVSPPMTKKQPMFNSGANASVDLSGHSTETSLKKDSGTVSTFSLPMHGYSKSDSQAYRSALPLYSHSPQVVSESTETLPPMFLPTSKKLIDNPLAGMLEDIDSDDTNSDDESTSIQFDSNASANDN